jgi:O-antigen/teichoic acid export membrane protein
VPTLGRLLATGRRRDVLVLLVKGAVALGALAVAAAPAAFWLGPPLVALVLGDDYAATGLDLAVIVVGVLAHIGLVVVTQVHVARARHGTVAATWLSGLAAAAVTFAAVGPPVLAGELAFLVGSAVGAVVSGLVLVRRRRGAGLTAGG